MKKLITLFVLIVTVSSCTQDAVVSDMEELNINQASFAKNDGKVDVCHKGKIINVSVNAIKAHRDHGDGIDMDGDGYFDIENGCSEVDCDDNNALVNGCIVTGS